MGLKMTVAVELLVVMTMAMQVKMAAVVIMAVAAACDGGGGCDGGEIKGGDRSGYGSGGEGGGEGVSGDGGGLAAVIVVALVGFENESRCYCLTARTDTPQGSAPSTRGWRTHPGVGSSDSTLGPRITAMKPEGGLLGVWRRGGWRQRWRCPGP